MISTWFSTWIILVGHFQPIFGSILFVFRSRLRRLWFELKWFKNKRFWSIFPHRCGSLKIFSIIGPSRCINEVLEKWHVCQYWHVVTKKEVMLYIDQHSQKIDREIGWDSEQNVNTAIALTCFIHVFNYTEHMIQNILEKEINDMLINIPSLELCLLICNLWLSICIRLAILFELFGAQLSRV